MKHKIIHNKADYSTWIVGIMDEWPIVGLTRLSLFGAETDYFQGGGGHFPLFFGGYSPKTGCGADPVG